MEGLQVVVDATQTELPGGDCVAHGRVTAIGAIPKGTSSGLATVLLVTTLPDGATVVGETTLALLHSATRALAARYPDPRP